MKKIYLFFTFLIVSSVLRAVQHDNILISPNGNIEVIVSIGEDLTYTVKRNGKTLLSPSALAMSLSDGEVWGRNARLRYSKKIAANKVIPSPFYRKTEVKDEYNGLQMIFHGQWGLEFRVYNDGVAYRFINHRKNPFNVVDEEVNYCFTDDVLLTMAYVNAKGSFEDQFFNSFENIYTTASLSKVDDSRLVLLPAVAALDMSTKVCIIESDLESYPGLYLTSANKPNSLKAVFAPYPKDSRQGGHNQLQAIVTQRETYIARVNGKRTFPWRGIVVSDTDIELANSDMSYLLAAPLRLDEIDWIRPGKVAWEWWNDMNLEGVDFQTGINNATYKYYIDFASANGIEYVILDEGWAVNLKADLMAVVPDIDLKELVEYGKAKNVGIVLWAGYLAFDRDMENVCRHYSEIGVKGFKVDFMDRDDQQMVEFVHRAAETAARYHLFLDLHGMYKPAGLNRTWPNILNFEGVFGLEQMKFCRPMPDMVTYDVTVPFIRQVAGPMDYTQGAMKNVSKENSYVCFSEPMSQGTRCHQLAAYMVFDSPLNMLCDSPTNYQREPESLEFIAGIPTVWGQTLVLDGRMGEYIVTARRHNETWYVGGLTGWTAREFTLDCSFLGDGQFKVTLFKDGINAHRKGTDYTKEIFSVTGGQQLKLHMAPGGGFALKIDKM
ncbi:glycoside hydrolase family 97 protein [Bacteroides sp.]|uniref:glycoside hydrolase family 97 protein n=1 Tax=Bacteroides sp. TaxID=29523 RepID=UPI002621984E|nr:glycoside hydrolase family 97 protein [Bacteroides sp.]